MVEPVHVEAAEQLVAVAIKLASASGECAADCLEMMTYAAWKAKQAER
jgi:hypothetical protein